MSDYLAVTDDDLDVMLRAIGVASFDDLLDAIPEEIRMKGALDLPAGRTEQDVMRHLADLARRNTSCDDETSFLGGGMYDHYVPALVDAIVSRSEFLTPYTPYQPEISQGGLQVMFEYQTAICELTGLDISNASVYEGPSAVAAAAYMAWGQNHRPEYVVSEALHPHAKATLRTTAHGWGGRVVEVPLRDGVTSADDLAAAVGPGTGAVIVQQPNFLGAVEDLRSLSDAAHRAGAVMVASCDPIALSLLATPGECGVDIAVGEGQPLGNRLDFGGPSFGFLAATSAFTRRMPGRIAGQTTDADGRRGFVLTLQTREQHIRREKATSNICTAQALNALAGVLHLAWLGREGFVGLGELLARRTHYAREQLCAIPGVTPLHTRPVVREFAVELDGDVNAVIAHCQQAHGINPGHALAADFPGHPNGLLVAVTEQRTKADIDALVRAVRSALGATVGEVAV
ncbi:MAG: aminomethyl-transferring glycine dehydrogenase subunit GcvPA [Thermoleophilia bacterium]|nr:aminomethyl-transferring glycine dehydrogenase subunit GcvPA [Thermoleophilia bacterium]